MKNKNLIAIDYGTKKTGLAYSVEGFCFVYGTFGTAQIYDILEKFIAEKNPIKIIIGMPYNIDGSMSEHGKRVEKFGKKIFKKFGLEVVFHDERLTTSEARISFDEWDFDGDLDAESARLILEDYLKSLTLILS